MAVATIFPLALSACGRSSANRRIVECKWVSKLVEGAFSTFYDDSRIVVSLTFELVKPGCAWSQGPSAFAGSGQY